MKETWDGSQHETYLELREGGMSASAARGALAVAYGGTAVDLGAGQALRYVGEEIYAIESTVMCRYAVRHRGSAQPVPATTEIDCGRVGVVPACQACADFYARMS